MPLACLQFSFRLGFVFVFVSCQFSFVSVSCSFRFVLVFASFGYVSISVVSCRFVRFVSFCVLFVRFVSFRSFHFRSVPFVSKSRSGSKKVFRERAFFLFSRHKKKVAKNV